MLGAVPSPCLVKAPSLCAMRAFTGSATSQTRLRDNMFRWLEGPGQVHKSPSNGPHYLGSSGAQGRSPRRNQKVAEKSSESQATSDGEASATAPRSRGEESGRRPPRPDLIPFPANRQFKSEAVLSEDLKDHIWHRVMVAQKSIRRVSADLHIEMRRVGAVVRLKSLEKRWEQEGKRLATPYARAVLSMLPQTPLTKPATPHESINDLPTHQATRPQIFRPTPESQRFTREAAAGVFAPGLFPSDKRVPHPQLVKAEAIASAAPGMAREDALGKAWEDVEQGDQSREETRLRVVRRAEATTKTAHTARWEFKIRDVKVDRASIARNVQGVGARYGVPAQDRKKGQVKIPTHVA